MNRSLILAPLLAIWVSIADCRAQEVRRNLQNSITRLEQRLKNVDNYLKSLQDGKKGQTAPKTSQPQAEEVKKLKAIIAQQDDALSKQSALLARERGERRASADLAQTRPDQKAREQHARIAEQLAAMRSQIEGRDARAKQLEALCDTLEQRLRETAEESNILRKKLEQATQDLGSLTKQFAKNNPPTSSATDAKAEEETKVREPADRPEQTQNAALHAKLMELERAIQALQSERRTSDQRQTETRTEHGNLNEQALRGIGTIIIHADEGTVNLHIQSSLPQAPKAQSPKSQGTDKAKKKSPDKKIND